MENLMSHQGTVSPQECDRERAGWRESEVHSVLFKHVRHASHSYSVVPLLTTMPAYLKDCETIISEERHFLELIDSASCALRQ